MYVPNKMRAYTYVLYIFYLELQLFDKRKD